MELLIVFGRVQFQDKGPNLGRVYRLGRVDICGICARTAEIGPGREMSILELGGASNKIIVDRCCGIRDFSWPCTLSRSRA